MLEILIQGLIMIAILFGAAAYMTLAERVVMAWMQLRLGPNRVGPLGLLQPIADGIKLLTKERFQPSGVEKLTYWIAPGISLFCALFAFVLIPVGQGMALADINAGIVFLLSISSLAVYGIVLAGWSSNSRYSLLGALRGTAQLISYEIPMGLALLTPILMASTLSLNGLVEAQRGGWFVWTNPISFLIYVITAFAETNRAPFDMPEAEQELVGGYHTEYGGLKFAIFFIGEYINILVVSAIATTLFLGGWLGPFEWGKDLPIVWFAIKMALFIFFFIWVRATLPRLRYDQLMSLGWKVLVPLATLNLIVTAWAVLGGG